MFKGCELLQHKCDILKKESLGNEQNKLYVKRSNSVFQLDKLFSQDFTAGCQDKFARLFLTLFPLIFLHILATALSYRKFTSETFPGTIRLS